MTTNPNQSEGRHPDGMVNEQPLTYIRWGDSLGCSGGWGELSRLKAEVFVCHSVGWIAKETETALVIVPHYHASKDSVGAVEGAAGEMTIPKTAILERVAIDLGALARDRANRAPLSEDRDLLG